MRLFILIAGFVVLQGLSLGAAAQQADVQSVRSLSGLLNTALLKKDSVVLKNLLHDRLTYGHSNGWIESKKEVIGDLFSGKLVYNKIEQSDPEVVIDGNTACLRAAVDLKAAMGKDAVELRLSVLQVWVRRGKSWVLLSRQSTRI